LRNARAFPLLPAALASVPFGFVLVRVRVHSPPYDSHFRAKHARILLLATLASVSFETGPEVKSEAAQTKPTKLIKSGAHARVAMEVIWVCIRSSSSSGPELEGQQVEIKYKAQRTRKLLRHTYPSDRGSMEVRVEVETQEKGNIGNKAGLCACFVSKKQ